jgi:drug/metabolite transporter (DMT)-like permease
LANYVVSSIALSIASLLFSRRSRGDASPAISGGNDTSSSDKVGAEDKLALRAGLELGAYLFLGSCFQLFGMRTTSASRGAFIVQLTTVITPILASLLSGRKPTPTELGGCLLAFGGVALLVGESGANAATASTLGGEALIAISAVFYSLHVVRLSRLAPGLKPLKLARAKELARFAYAGIALLTAVLFSPAQAAALSAFIENAVASPVASAGGAAAVVLWTGVVTTAFPTWAQSFGQRSLDASTASIIYTTQPLWCVPPVLPARHRHLRCSVARPAFPHNLYSCQRTVDAIAPQGGRIARSAFSAGYGAHSLSMRPIPSRRSALFGALLLNERLTPQGLAGAAIIFIALALVARKSSSRESQGPGAGGDQSAD